MTDRIEAAGPFAGRLVVWQRLHGRHDLPWQQTADPYRVWLSEVMLQQTQVVTVLGYFDRFLQRFPDVFSLADAPSDDVLALWSGLGYYSRARNLHRCAQVIVNRYGGTFPSDVASLQALPGIGPSTAAAIAAFCFSQRVTIFDGNVKRVVARYTGFADDLSVRANELSLLAHANALLPPPDRQVDMPAYTQGLMDLGATLCTRHQPHCQACPMQQDCLANLTQRQQALPCKTKRLVRKTQDWFVLIAIRPDGAVWLMRRPPTGIWASLYAFPVAASLETLLAQARLQDGEKVSHLPSFTHSLTHLDMVIRPVCVAVQPGWSYPTGDQSAHGGEWVQPGGELSLGVPVPVKRLMAGLASGVERGSRV